MIIGIVAISKNSAIGKDGKLPWHYTADLKFFKQTTLGNALVMGSTTWRAIGRPLPERLNIVLSRSREIETEPDVIVLSSVDAVLNLGRYLSGDVFIIGGARTYEAFKDLIDRWIVTDIPIEVPDADTFIPSDVFDAFELVERKTLADGLAVRVMQRTAK